MTFLTCSFYKHVVFKEKCNQIGAKGGDVGTGKRGANILQLLLSHIDGGVDSQGKKCYKYSQGLCVCSKIKILVLNRY